MNLWKSLSYTTAGELNDKLVYQGRGVVIEMCCIN